MSGQFSVSFCSSHLARSSFALAFFIFPFYLIALFGTAGAQNIMHDQNDILSSYGSECYEDHLTFYPSISCQDKIKGNFNVLPVYVNAVYNTDYARGLNDGPAWQGKGSNLTTAFGFSGRVGKLTYVFNPVVQYVENLDFNTGSQLRDRGEFQYPFTKGIDFVTRFGNSSNIDIYPGQSEISLRLDHVTFSLSTQNMHWGPAVYNPIVMSSNAQGIPHFRIGTTKPVSTGIGEFEGNILWGYMRESDFFNDDSGDDIRYFNGLTLAYAPSFFEGFSIGIHRILYTQTQFLSGFFEDGFAVFSGAFNEGDKQEVNGNVTNDVYDQIASISFQYENKEQDFNIYLEWARGDFSGGIVDFLEQPDHNSGVTFGARKAFSLKGDKKITLLYEHSALATWETSFIRPSGSFYSHGVNRQGYTNNGQIMGASIGPGGSGDVIHFSYLWKDREFSFEYQRTRFNDDYFFTNFTSRGPTPQDIEHQVGVAFGSRFAAVSYKAGLYAGIRDNYLFDDETTRVNLHSNVALRYHF